MTPASPEAYEAFIRGKGYLSRPPRPRASTARSLSSVEHWILDPGYAAAHALLGRAYWVKYQLTKDQQYVAKMRDACEDSLKQSPTPRRETSAWALLDAGTGHYQQAASELQIAIGSDPTNDLAYRKLAFVHENLGRIEQAEKTYENAIQAHSEDPSNYAALGFSMTTRHTTARQLPSSKRQ